MGLTLSAHDFYSDINIGYINFFNFRYFIAKSLSEKHGKLYEAIAKNRSNELAKVLSDEWNKDCDDSLDILLWHSDCDGRLTPKECTKIKKSLSKINVNFEGREDLEEFYEDFLDMLKHCSKRRVIMYFY